MRRIDVEIRELILHGVDPDDVTGLPAAIEAHLTERLASAGVSTDVGRSGSLERPDHDRHRPTSVNNGHTKSDGSTKIDVAARVADAVFERLPEATRGGAQ